MTPFNAKLVRVCVPLAPFLSLLLTSKAGVPRQGLLSAAVVAEAVAVVAVRVAAVTIIKQPHISGNNSYFSGLLPRSE